MRKLLYLSCMFFIFCGPVDAKQAWHNTSRVVHHFATSGSDEHAEKDERHALNRNPVNLTISFSLTDKFVVRESGTRHFGVSQAVAELDAETVEIPSRCLKDMSWPFHLILAQSWDNDARIHIESISLLDEKIRNEVLLDIELFPKEGEAPIQCELRQRLFKKTD